MSLIQSRMPIERALLWARVVTCVGAFFALGNLVYYSTTLRGWDVWAIGLSGFFAAMAIYGVFLWRKAKKRLKEFEATNGRDAGRQDRAR